MRSLDRHRDFWWRLESPVKWGRWWLSLSYVLATLMAQGVHDHHRATDDSVLESNGDCDDSRLHIADHKVVDLGDSPSVCASCQFRGQHSLWAMVPQPLPGPGVAIPTETNRPSTHPGSPLRTRCRAPPLA